LNLVNDGNGNPVPSNSSSAPVILPATPSLRLVKSADPSTVNAVNSLVTYSFLAFNTGNQTLSNVTVTDSSFSGSGNLGVITCGAPVASGATAGNAANGTQSLKPHQQMLCRATYTVTMADTSAGVINNSATSAGQAPTPPGGAMPPQTSSPISNASVATSSAPTRLTLAKTADPAAANQVGQVVVYSFVASNVTSATQTQLTIHDSTFTGQNPAGLGPISCGAAVPIGSTPVAGNSSNGQAALPPHTHVLCQASYSIVQADINAGSVTNTAYATDVNGTAPVTSNQSSAPVTLLPSPYLTLTKSVSPASVTRAGSAVLYSFLVTNGGNLPLANLTVTDQQFSATGALGSITRGNPVSTANPSVAAPGTRPNGAATLQPGQQILCQAPYAISQGDFNSGVVNNIASAAGQSPTRDDGSALPLTRSNTSTATVTGPNPSALTTVKSVSPARISAIGQILTYSFLDSNSGSTALTNVLVFDAGFTGANAAGLGTITCGAPVPIASPSVAKSGSAANGSVTLRAGYQALCQATYTTAQGDIDNGQVTNSTYSTAQSAGTPVTSPLANATVTAVQSSALTMAKNASRQSVTALNQPITYSFLQSNAGNIALSNIRVVDTVFSGTGPLGPISCGAPVPTATPSTATAGTTINGQLTLRPGEQALCTADYLTTQNDIDAGSITNTAHSVGNSGTRPDGTVPPATNSTDPDASVTAVPSPALTVLKLSAPSSITRALQVITYTFRVTNSGNVTLSTVSVVDSPVAPAGGSTREYTAR